MSNTRLAILFAITAATIVALALYTFSKTGALT